MQSKKDMAWVRIATPLSADNLREFCRDLERLFRLTDDMHHEALPHLFLPTGEISRSPGHIATLINDEDATLFVAETRGAIIGFLNMKLYTTKHPVMLARTYIHIHDIVISQEFQGQGVAQLLLDEAIVWGQERGVTQFQLNVFEFNQRAIAFYEKSGFVTGSRKMWLDVKHEA